MTPAGLSPWARGIPHFSEILPAIGGSIPVGTGNPVDALGRCRYSEVYPRGHGESGLDRRRVLLPQGLSPWARGIRSSATSADPSTGSIPVGTGNPPWPVVERLGMEVYPRGHGESALLTSSVRLSSGLSPWARGILVATRSTVDVTRSIPVGTGNPRGICGRSTSTRVYPRGHGESRHHATRFPSASGLSPWARGIRDRQGV